MTVASKAIPSAIAPPSSRIPLVDSKTGVLADAGIALMQQHHNVVNGLSQTVSCNCTNVGNVYTLTPIQISPQVPNYYSFWSFAFVASATSTGLITATVIPYKGVLPTLPVYKTSGSAQATTGDLIINLFYLIYYVDTLNSGNGGFVLK